MSKHLPECVEEERNLLPSLKTLYEKQSEVDLALVTEDKEVILCHSVVAAANSYDMSSRLLGYDHDKRPVTDTNAKYCLQVNDVKKNQLSRIVDYFYTGKIEITADDVADLLLAAAILNVRFVEKKAKEVIKKLLCMENYFTFLQFSKENVLVWDLKLICYDFMVAKFPELLATNEISNLDVDMLIVIISEVGWRLEDEDMSLDAIVQWLENHPKLVTSDMVERLVECAPFDECTSRKVYEVLDKCPQLFAAAKKIFYRKGLSHLLLKRRKQKVQMDQRADREQRVQRADREQKTIATCGITQHQHQQVRSIY